MWSPFASLFISTLLSITTAAPTTEITTLKPSSGSSSQSESIQHDTQLLHPHIITIERLASLLRRAGEIFRPLTETTQTVEPVEIAPIPYQQLQPPTHPYNFYLPPFEHEEQEHEEQLDEKSRKMENFTPPPPPSGGNEETNFYAIKPKKLPKKFNAAEKLVNVKWLNAFEREALADANGELPKAAYLANDERNRINFDDSFFAVDMHVNAPADNNPHKETKSNESEHEFLNQSEEGEDLVAVPATHFGQITFSQKN